MKIVAPVVYDLLLCKKVPRPPVKDPYQNEYFPPLERDKSCVKIYFYFKFLTGGLSKRDAVSMFFDKVSMLFL